MQHSYTFPAYNKLHFYFVIAFGLILFQVTVSAQNSVGIGTISPNSHAVLDIASSDGTQGLLVPRLTSMQRNALGTSLANDAKNNGLLVYDTTDNTFYFWDGTKWEKVGAASAGISAGNGITITNNIISTNLIGENGITIAPQPTGEVVIGVSTDGDDSDVSGPLNNIQLKEGVVTDSELRSADTDDKDTDRSVTTNHIRNNAITTSKIAPGTNNAYLTTDGNGAVGWANFPITPEDGKIPIGNNAGGFNSIVVNGDVSLGSTGEATVQGLQGRPIAAVDDLLNNQVLVWNGQQWEPKYLYLDQSTQGYDPLSTAGNRYYSFDATDFRQVSNIGTASVSFTNDTGEGIQMKSTTATNNYLVAPLHLPHGAVITEIKLFYFDNDASNDITFELYEKDLVNHASTVKGSASSSNANGFKQDISFPISPALVIDNTKNAYTLRIKLAGATTPFQYVYGGIVYYKVTQPD